MIMIVPAKMIRPAAPGLGSRYSVYWSSVMGPPVLGCLRRRVDTVPGGRWRHSTASGATNPSSRRQTADGRRQIRRQRHTRHDGRPAEQRCRLCSPSGASGTPRSLPPPSRLPSQARDQAEAEVAGRGVDRLCHARRRAISPAVVGGAEVGASLDHLARDRDVGHVRVVALLHLPASGVAGHTAACLGSRIDCTNPRSTPRRFQSCRTTRIRSPGTIPPGRCPRNRPAPR